MVVKLTNPADTGSNKHDDYAVQLTAQAYSYLRPTNFRVAVMRPKIDRLAVTLPVLSVADQVKIRGRLESLSSDPNDPTLEQWGKKKGWGAGKYARSYGLNLGNGGRVLVQCTAGKGSVAFLRFEFNPDGVGTEGVAQFRDLLPEITCGKVTYEMFANVGKVTRLDIAVDLINIDLEDLLVSTPKVGVSMGYFGLTGKAETKYLSVNKKGSNLYVYDRRARLRKRQQDGIGDGPEYGDAKHTRVEVRTKADKPIVALPALKNRLKRIDLVDIEAAEPPEEQHHWQHFQDSCRYRGVAGALALLPDGVRDQYEAAISAVSGHLWRPDKLWGLWPEAVEKSGLLP